MTIQNDDEFDDEFNLGDDSEDGLLLPAPVVPPANAPKAGAVDVPPWEWAKQNLPKDMLKGSPPADVPAPKLPKGQGADVPPWEWAKSAGLGEPTKPAARSLGRSGFAPDVESALDRAAEAHKLDPALLRAMAGIESGGDPRKVTGSYKGMLQLHDDEFRRYAGDRDIFDPEANAFAGAAKLKDEIRQFESRFGREPTGRDIYLVHQQGLGGYEAHKAAPNRPAWESMYSTREGREKGPDWAKRAIWGNLPDAEKKRFGSVENVTSGAFTEFWDRRYDRELQRRGMAEPVQVAQAAPTTMTDAAPPWEVAKRLGLGKTEQQPDGALPTGWTQEDAQARRELVSSPKDGDLGKIRGEKDALEEEIRSIRARMEADPANRDSIMGELEAAGKRYAKLTEDESIARQVAPKSTIGSFAKLGLLSLPAGVALSPFLREWGNLSPDEAKEQLKVRKQEADDEVKLYEESLREVADIKAGRRLKDASRQKWFDEQVERTSFLPKYAHLTGYDLLEAQYKDGLKEAKKKAREVKEIDAGLRPAISKTASRAAVENLGTSVVDVVASIPKVAGIAAGYIGRSSGFDTGPETNTLVKVGEWISDAAKDAMPGDLARREDFMQKLAGGAGSMIGFMGPGAALQALGLTGRATRIGTTLVGGGAANSAETFEEATNAMRQVKTIIDPDTGKPVKFTPEEKDRLIAAGFGFLLGMTEAAPIERMLTRPSGGGWKQIVSSGRAGAIEEGGQEGFQTLGGNIVASKTYDPERDPLQGVTEGMLIGALLGFKMNAGRATLDAWKHRHTQAVDDAERTRIDNAMFEAMTKTISAGAMSDSEIAEARKNVAKERPEILSQFDAAVAAAKKQPAAGQPPAVPGATPPPIPVSATDAETSILKKMGWTDEDIADMEPEQRQQELEDAADRGITADSVSPPAPAGGSDLAGLIQQARDLVSQETPRSAMYIPPETVSEISGNPEFVQQIASALQGQGTLVDDVDGKGGMLLAKDEATGAAVKQQAAGGADVSAIVARLNGETPAAAPAAGRTSPPPLPTAGDGTRKAPVRVAEQADVQRAEQVVAKPTDAQKEAGNYQKGHIKVQGLDIAIENPKGSERTGTAPDGSTWSTTMPATYGYFKRSKGKDGDQIDVYVGPNPETGKAFVVDQIDPDTGKFDEHKVMLGYDTASAAQADYEAAFSDDSGADRMGGITEMPVEDLKKWVSSGRKTKPVSDLAKKPDMEAAQPVEEAIEEAATEPDTLEGDPLSADQIEEIVEAWAHLTEIDQQINAGKKLQDAKLDEAILLNADFIAATGREHDTFDSEAALREYLGPPAAAAAGVDAGDSQGAQSQEGEGTAEGEGQAASATRLGQAGGAQAEVAQREQADGRREGDGGGQRDAADEVGPRKRYDVLREEIEETEAAIEAASTLLDEIEKTDFEAEMSLAEATALEGRLAPVWDATIRSDFLDTVIKLADESIEIVNRDAPADVRDRVVPIYRDIARRARAARKQVDDLSKRTDALLERFEVPDETDIVGPDETQAPTVEPSSVSQGEPLSDAEIDTLVSQWEYVRRVASQPKPQSLAAYVIASGGIRDTGREVRHIAGSAKERPGLVSKNGRGLDDMALSAWEAGFLGHLNERPTISEFLESLQEDLHTGQVVRLNDEPVLDDLRVADEIERELADYGITRKRFRTEESLRRYLGQSRPGVAAETARDEAQEPAADEGQAESDQAPEAAVDLAAVENWWRRELTPAGRRLAVQDAGLKASVAKVLWQHLTPAQQAALSAEFQKQQRVEPAAEDAAPAPAPTTRAAFIEALTSGLNDRGTEVLAPNGTTYRIDFKPKLDTYVVASKEADSDGVWFTKGPGRPAQWTRGEAAELAADEAFPAPAAKKPADPFKGEMPETPDWDFIPNANWRDHLVRARVYATALRIDHRGKSLEEIVKAIDEAMTKNAGVPGVDVWMSDSTLGADEARIKGGEYHAYASNKKYTVDGYGDRPSAAIADAIERLKRRAAEDDKKLGQTSLVPEATTKEKIAAAEKEKANKGKAKAPVAEAPKAETPVDKIRNRMLGEGFADIRQARQFAKDAGVEGTNKAIEEALEAGIVAAARQIVAEGADPAATYAKMVALYNRQPNLSSRTGTSSANQAYSTPMPLAYLASRLAGVAAAESVYEPTAGNGALIMEATPSPDVHVNELDPSRAAALRAQGFEVTEKDGSDTPSFDNVASVIMNPPFGAVKAGGKSTVFTVKNVHSGDPWTTTSIDHAVAINGLNAMADDGRAVLIVGGVNATDVTERRKGYRGQAKREFYYNLYSGYNVVDHFTVSGDLYAKQGAGFPVDVIVIEGRGKSERALPAANPPMIFDSWDSLAEKLNATGNDRADGRPAGRTDQRVEQSNGGNEDGGTAASGARSGGSVSDSEAKPARVRKGRDRGQPGDAVEPAATVAPDNKPAVDRDAGRVDQPDTPRAPRVKTERKAPPAGSGQSNYVPASTAEGLDTLIPVNMADAAKQALARIVEKEGDLNTFVANNLGYEVDAEGPYFVRDGKKERPFSAEQIDAIASAIENTRRGAGMIIGDQCVAGHTRIYDPVAKTHTQIKDLASRGRPISVLALTAQGLQVATATSPFRKGVADLYRVAMDDGRTITVTRQHRFLTPDGWRTLDDGLSEGHYLASAEGHLANSLGCDPSIRPADVAHSIGTDANWTDHCSAYSRPCGEQPHAAQEAAQAFAPSPSDVLARIQSAWLSGDQDASRAHSRLHRDSDRRARNNSSRPSTLCLSWSSGRVGASHGSTSQSKPEGDAPFRGETALLQQEGGGVGRYLFEVDGGGLSLLDGASARHSAAASGARLAVADRVSRQFVHTSDPSHNRIAAGIEVADQLSSDDYTGWRRIMSITFVGREEFFDMWVPGFENYVAEGVVNHNTGIGKGRVAAGMLRYAMMNDMVPLFVTEKPDLYGDMYRDLNDIGVKEMLGRDINMFLTNAGESIGLDEEAMDWKTDADAWDAARDDIAMTLFGETYYNLDAGQKDAVKAKITTKRPPKTGLFLTGKTPDKTLADMDRMQRGEKIADIVFTTYDQMSTLGTDKKTNMPRPNPRRQFLSSIINDAFMVLDESHNAGGTTKSGWEKKGGVPDRSEYVRELAARAKGVMFSSATYAKRPDVMDLYSRTDMGRAVDDPKNLPNLIKRGGVPMQQIVASMLSKAGQYLRRERSFEGVEYAVEPVPVNQKNYETFSDTIRAIFEFDLAVQEARKAIMEEVLDAKGMNMSKDSGVGQSAAHTTSFSSIMHNIVNQMLLSIKSGQAAQRAIQAAKAGEKPVIALANTNESFIRDFAEQEGVAIGQAMQMDFSEVLRRYLKRTLRVTIKHPNKKVEHVDTPVERLGAGLQKMYRDAMEMVDGADLSDMPISPIDAIRNQVQKAGLSVAEITGRQTMIDYSAQTPKYVARPKSEMGSAGKRASIAAFNRGSLDVLILNRSGSTGVSMHASSKFRDRRRRRMILAQAEGNIDTHLQMLGRVHRTGQVIPPAYSQIAAEIPAEMRPLAVLMRKMASLNANTTGARGSMFMSDAVDFMNEVGDKIVADILMENPDIDEALGGAIKVDNDGNPVLEDAAKRATGRLVLLTPTKQAELLDMIQKSYKAEIEQLDALGENPLEAKTLDLQAKTIETTVLKPRQGDSPFLDEVRIEKASVKAQGRAMLPSDILTRITDALSLPKWEGDVMQGLVQAQARGRTAVDAKIREVMTRAREWIRTDIADMSPEAKITTTKRHEEQAARWQATASIVRPGAFVRLSMPAGDIDGIVMQVERTGSAKLPVALGSWEVRIAVPDGAREYVFPMSKLFPPGYVKSEDEKGAAISASDLSARDMVTAFEDARKEGRETRYIVTGNILGGFDQVAGKGRIVNYSTDSGEMQPGVLMGREFDIQKFMGRRAVRFGTPAQAMKFLEQAPLAEINDTDGIVKVRPQRGGYFMIEMPAARGIAGKYFTDRAVIRALGGKDFERRSGKMMAIGLTRAEALAAMEQFRVIGATFETRQSQEIADAIVAADAPTKAGPATVDRAVEASGSRGQKAVTAVATMLKMGRTTVIPKTVVEPMLEEIRQSIDLLPEGIPAGVVARIEPNRDRRSPYDAVAVVVDTNGTEHRLPINWADLASTRAFSRIDGGLVGFLRLGPAELADQSLGSGAALGSGAGVGVGQVVSGGEVAGGLNRLVGQQIDRGQSALAREIRALLAHESIHVRRRIGAVSGRVWRRLVAHADALRILDKEFGTYLREVGHPDAANQPGGVTIRDIYEQSYALEADFQERMDQESVAVMVELIVHGQLLPMEIEAIASELRELLDGDAPSGSTAPATAESVMFALGGYKTEPRKGDRNPHIIMRRLQDRAGKSFLARVVESGDDITVEMYADKAPDTPENQLPKGISRLGEKLGHVDLNFMGVGHFATHGHRGPLYEVGMVEVEDEHRMRGLAKATYNMIEDMLGTQMMPSGTLLPPGYEHWKRRNPELVRGHQYHRGDEMYYSPRKIKEDLDGYLAEYKAYSRPKYVAEVMARERGYQSARVQLISERTEVPESLLRTGSKPDISDALVASGKIADIVFDWQKTELAAGRMTDRQLADSVANALLEFRDADALRRYAERNADYKEERIREELAIYRGMWRKVPKDLRTERARKMMFALGPISESEVDAETGQSMRRDLDELGFYSKALEAAKSLKQEKGTPEQMLAQLKKAGVKDAEIEATGLADLFREKAGSTTALESDAITLSQNPLQDMIAETRQSIATARDAITAELGKPNPRLTVTKGKVTHVLTKGTYGDGAFRITRMMDGEPIGHSDFKNTPEDITRAAQEMSVRPQQQGDRTASPPRRARLNQISKSDIVKYLEENRVGLREVNYQNKYVDLGGERPRLIDKATKWSRHSLDPSNPTYRETVIHLPARYDALNSFHADMKAKYGVNEFDAMPLSPDERQRLAAIKAEIPKAAEFKSGHFPEPNIIGHMMTSMVHMPLRQSRDELHDIGLRMAKAVLPEPKIVAHPDYPGKFTVDVGGGRRAPAYGSEHLARVFYYENGVKYLGSGAMASAVKKGTVTEAEANAYGWTRGWSGAIDQRPAVYLIDQIQSDWGQKLRDGGVRDEKKIAELKERSIAAQKAEQNDWPKRMRELKREVANALDLHSLIDYAPTDSAFRSLAYDSKVPDELRTKITELYVDREALRDARRLADAEFQTANAATPGHPLVNTTDQWTTTTLRRAITQAVEAGAEYIAVPHGDTVLSYNPGGEDGMRGFYGKPRATPERIAELKENLVEQEAEAEAATGVRRENAERRIEAIKKQIASAEAVVEGIVPKNLRKLLSALDKDSPAPVKVKTVEATDGPRGWNRKEEYPFDKAQTGFTLFPITDKVRASVREGGQPMFSMIPTFGLGTPSAEAAASEIAKAFANVANDEANVQYRANTLQVAGFIGDWVVPAEGESATATSLYEAYAEWVEALKGEAVALPTFTAALNDLGLVNQRIAGRTRYVGIRVLPDDARPAPRQPAIAPTPAPSVVQANARDIHGAVSGGRGFMAAIGELISRLVAMVRTKRDPVTVDRLVQARLLQAAVANENDPNGKIVRNVVSMFSSVPSKDVTPKQKAAVLGDVTAAIRIVERVAGLSVDIDFRDTIPLDGANMAQQAATRAAGFAPTTAGGGYVKPRLDGRAVILLAVNDPQFDLKTAAGHEAFHHVEEVLASESERRLLTSPAEMERMKRLAATEIGVKVDSPRFNELQDKEIRAIAFQRYRRMQEEGIGDASRLHIGIRRVFNRLIGLFQSVRNALAGRGFDSYESLFERARTGRMALDYAARQVDARAATAPAGSRARNVIDPQMEPTGRVDGEPFDLANVQVAARFMASVPLDAIRTIQNSVSIRAVKSKLGMPISDDGRPVSVFKYGNRYYVNDGNHRIEALRARGARAIRVEVIDLKDSGNAPVLADRGQTDAAPQPVGPEAAAAAIPADFQASLIPAAAKVYAQRWYDRHQPKLYRVRIGIQDRMLPVRRVEEEIERTLGIKLPNGMSTYVAESLYHGRAGERLNDLQAKHIEPLTALLRANNIDFDVLGNYLYARHAKERNAAMLKLDPNNPAGSGMTDKEADGIIGALEQGPRGAAFKRAAGMVRAMLQEALDTRFAAGLLTRQQYTDWTTQYQDYVPLRGFEANTAVDEPPHVGRGMDTRGPESKRALGRRSRADNPAAYAMQQAVEAVIRAEKNRVDKTLYRAIQAFPDPDRWRVFKGVMKRRVNPTTGLVESYWVPANFAAYGKEGENVFGVKINGKQHYMWVEPGLARALRSATPGVLGTAPGRALYRMSRFYARLVTSFNPEFVVSNYLRDLQTAMMNVGDVTGTPLGIRRRIAKEAASLKTIRGVMAALQSHEGRTVFGTKRAANETMIGTKRTAEAQRFSKWFDEYRLAGGKISFIDMDDIDRIKTRIDGAVREGNTRRMLRGAFQLIDNANSAVENGVRLSLYVAMRENGQSIEAAATAARELTVNFNRKGEWGPTVNAFYLFFNASVQGTTRLIQAAVRSQTVRRGIAGIFLAGIALDLLNYAIAGDDDDGENAYDKIDDWKKEKNLIIMMPGRKDYVQIPMPYGYNVFHIAGQKTAALGRTGLFGAGKEKPGKAVGAILGAMIESFSPFGAAPTIMQLASPTLLDPVAQIAENRNWFGGRIQPEKLPGEQRHKPDSENYFSTAPSWAIDLAKTLNKIGGGDATKSGNILGMETSVSPETIEHLADFLGGGVAKFLLNSWNTGERAVRGQEWAPEKTPFVRRVYGKATAESRRRDFYEKWNEVEQAHYRMSSYRKAKDDAGMASLREESKAELAAFEGMRFASRQLSALKKQSDVIQLNRSLDRVEKEKQLKAIQERENQLILRALANYRRITNQQKGMQ